MDLLPSPEQQQIVDACVVFLSREHPVERLHKVGDGNPLLNRALLARMADLGWFGLGLAENQGGVGYSLKEETLLCVEMGRFLVSPAVLGSVLGARAAVASGQAALAESIIAGEKLIGLAIASSGGMDRDGHIRGDYYLFEALDADLVLFADEQGVALVEKRLLGKTERLACLDEKVQLERVSVQNLSALVYVPSSTENIYLRGVLLSAAMQLGIAEAVRDRSVAYAKVRVQYGKPIGAFQAIKHYCAEMAVKCESVMSLVYHAAIVLNDPKGAYGENNRFDTLAAKLLACDAAQHNANTAVQIHGGMGFTQEMDIHLFVKRAQLLEPVFGGKHQLAVSLLSLDGPRL